MPSEITRTQFAIYAAIVVAVVLLGGRALRGGAEKAAAGAPGAHASASPASSGAPAPSGGVVVGRAGSGSAVVHVAGAVRRPGVYRLREGARVQDAVRSAGGRAPGADVNAVNLAAKVADGQQVVVPKRVAGGSGGAAVAGDAAGGGGAGTAPGVAGAPPGPPVNLNTATAEQLDTLDGVGPATARKILEYRTQHGGFRSVDDLGEIPGIGPKRLEAMRARVQV